MLIVCYTGHMLYSTSEAAKRLNITRDGVLKLITRGLLEAEKVGPIWIIREVDLKEYESRRRDVGRPPKPGPKTD